MTLEKETSIVNTDNTITEKFSRVDNDISNVETLAGNMNKTYYQATAPSSSAEHTLRKGDVWYDTGNGFEMYVFNNGQWQESKLGGAAIQELAITTAHIGSLDAGKIKTGTLKSILIYQNNNNYWNLGSSAVEVDGVTYPAETLKVVNGVIGGWTLSSSKIYGGDSETGVAAMQLPSNNTLYVFAAGGTNHSNYGDCPFRVTKTGKMYATDAELEGSIKVIGSLYIYSPDKSAYKNALTYTEVDVGYAEEVPTLQVGGGFTNVAVKQVSFNSSGSYINNGKYHYGIDADGFEFKLIGMSSSNNIKIGDSSNPGNTDIDAGKNLNLNTQDGYVRINGSRFYKETGDTWSARIQNSGYVTNSGARVIFSVPLPLIVDGTLSITSLTVIGRQNGSYVIGTSDNPQSIAASIRSVTKQEGFARIQIDFSSAPSGISNNAVIGIDANVTFKLS